MRGTRGPLTFNPSSRPKLSALIYHVHLECGGKRSATPLWLIELRSSTASIQSAVALDLIEKRKIPVYVVTEDLADRGIARGGLVPGVQLLLRTALPALFAEYALVADW